MTMMMTIMTTEVHFISCHKKRALLRWSKRRQTIRERSKENQGTILLPQYDHDLVPFKKLKYEKVNLELSQVTIRRFTTSLSSSKALSTTAALPKIYWTFEYYNEFLEYTYGAKEFGCLRRTMEEDQTNFGRTETYIFLGRGLEVSQWY